MEKGSLLSRQIDVYLSFRGDEDTCKFTYKLRGALENAGLRTFGNDKKLETGDSNIPTLLLKAIEKSWVCIVVFSKNYASSIWCLQELSQIAVCVKEQPDIVIVPVFYDVDPSEVRKQTNAYKMAFDLHEERFKADFDKVHRWKLAMTEVANFSSWDAQYFPGLQVIDKIIREVKTKIGQTVHVDNGLVGMKTRVKEVEKLLDLASNDVVRVIGICGMGGIGKSTLAAVIYNKISYYFDGFCFLANLSKLFKHDKPSLQQLLVENLKAKDPELRYMLKGKFLADPRLRNYKFLIVLDGVDLVRNHEALRMFVKSNWFGGGSRIIITTRDERHLQESEVDDIYKIKLLSEDEATQLLYKRTFICDYPTRGYEKFTDGALEYVNGLPLAIKLLGSSVYQRGVKSWRWILAQVAVDPDPKVVEELSTSFDVLDDMSKEIFLDIACFFVGKEINYVKEILYDCGLSADIGIKLLIEKSLMTILDQRIQMHSLLKKMGETIVWQKSNFVRGRQSRLCRFSEIYDVMLQNQATEKVEAIVLRLKDSEQRALRIEALSNMSNLRLLIFQNVKFFGTLGSLPNKLRYISWHQYPFSSLPSSFEPHTLVQLIMHESNVVELWEGRKMLPNLRNMNLCGSKSLIKVPDFRGIPNLERLDLQECTELLRLDPSITNLSKLKFLNLRKCSNLVSIPNSLFTLSSLEILNLACCSKLANCLKFFSLRSSIKLKLLN